MRDGKLTLATTAKTIYELDGGQYRCQSVGLIPSSDAAGDISYGFNANCIIPLTSSITIPVKDLRNLWIKSTVANDIAFMVIED